MNANTNGRPMQAGMAVAETSDLAQPPKEVNSRVDLPTTKVTTKSHNSKVLHLVSNSFTIVNLNYHFLVNPITQMFMSTHSNLAKSQMAPAANPNSSKGCKHFVSLFKLQVSQTH